MEHRPLGRAGLKVSALTSDSWAKVAQVAPAWGFAYDVIGGREPW